MSNTPAESVPNQTPVADTAVSETAAPQPKKFDNVHKTVASKAKALLSAFHSTGENIRGNINAALDGAGDAISGRKAGEVTGRKSGEQAPRRSVEPTVAESTPAPVETAISTEAPAVAPVATPAQAPAEASTSNEVVPATNGATNSTNQGTTEKRFPVGEFVNERIKRTVDLVIRVGSTLRSKGTRTAESLGTTLAEKKQRASRRFSRAPKATQDETEAAATAAASPVPATTPLPEPTVQQPAETTA